MSLRYIKRKARHTLHCAMKIPALYIENVGDTPIACNVRIHTRFDAIGELNGGTAYTATVEASIPKIIFKKDEVTPDRTAIVSVEPGEAYQIDRTDPPDDEYITAYVIRMEESKTIDLPVPENAEKSIIRKC